MRKLIDNILQPLQLKLDNTGIEWTFHIPAHLPPQFFKINTPHLLSTIIIIKNLTIYHP